MGMDVTDVQTHDPILAIGYAKTNAELMVACRDLGYYLDANIPDSTMGGLAAGLANPTNATFLAVQYASNFPSVHQLQVNLDRRYPTNMSRGFFVTNSAGLFVDANSNTWADWTNGVYVKVVSPEASTNDLYIQATNITDELKTLAGMAPIGIVVNGGERDLGVPGTDQTAWQFDPRVQAADVTTNQWSYTNLTGIS